MSDIGNVSEERTYAKVTLRLLPFLGLCYLIAYLDRVNVGFAKLHFQKELGFSALIVGHDLRELRTVVDRIAVLHAGLIVGYGTVDEVLAKPLHPYVRRLAELSA